MLLKCSLYLFNICQDKHSTYLFLPAYKAKQLQSSNYCHIFAHIFNKNGHGSCSVAVPWDTNSDNVTPDCTKTGMQIVTCTIYTHGFTCHKPISQHDLNVAESVQAENPERMTIVSNQGHVDGNQVRIQPVSGFMQNP